jgi:ribosomal protein S27AE
MKSKSGSAKHQHSYSFDSLEPGNLTCPSCGAEDALEYRADNVEVYADDDQEVEVEGMFCSECGDLFVNPEEGIRLLNKKAFRDHENTRYALVNGNIEEFTLH